MLITNYIIFSVNSPNGVVKYGRTICVKIGNTVYINPPSKNLNTSLVLIVNKTKLFD
jgi:hypothetical protein